MSGVVNVAFYIGGGECRGGECRTIVKGSLDHRNNRNAVEKL